MHSLISCPTCALQIHKELSGRKGKKTSSHNELHEEDKMAVESYAQELIEHLEDADAPKPRFQLVDFRELPEPDVQVANGSDDIVL